MTNWVKYERWNAELNRHVLVELDDHTIVSGNFGKVSETDDDLIFYPDIYNDSREDMIGNAVDPAYILRWMPYPDEDEDDDSDL